MPVKVIVGEHDPALGEETMRQTFTRWYPNCTVDVLTNCGHYGVDETPVALATSLESFLRGPLTGPGFPESEYLELLHSERRRFTWVMRVYGGRSAGQAEAEARQAYPYEPPEYVHRGVESHETTWHWAMLTLHGHGYPDRYPETPPAAYDAID